jgi:AraC family transcriptional regulator
LGEHIHAEDRVVMPVSGDFESLYERRVFQVNRQCGLFRPANVVHVDTYVAPTVCVSIALPPRERVVGGAFAVAGAELHLVVQRLSAELDASDATSELAVEGLCALVAGRVYGRHCDERRPAWLPRVRERLEGEYANPPTLQAIARDVQRDVSHVAKTFRRAYGKSIGEYVRELRVWRTWRFVEATSIPLADIAQIAGFADQSHFARIFKRRFGVTPGAYRSRKRRQSQ